MNIHIKTKNVELTQGLRSVINEKIGLLEKFIPFKPDQTILAEVEVGRETERHTNGESLYRAEINLSIDKRMLRTVALKSDINNAIDEAKNEMQIRITSHSNKAIDLMRKGARKAKNMLRFKN